MINIINFENKTGEIFYYLSDCDDYDKYYEKLSKVFNDHLHNYIGDFILDCFIPLNKRIEYSPSEIKEIIHKLKSIMKEFYEIYSPNEKFEFDIDHLYNIYTVSEIKNKINTVLKKNDEILIGDLFLEDTMDLYAFVFDNKVNCISKDEVFDTIDDTVYSIIEYLISNNLKDIEIFNLFKSIFEC